jgi:hypothetical protein
MVREYFETPRDTGNQRRGDHFLLWLALQGYVITPLKGELH